MPLVIQGKRLLIYLTSLKKGSKKLAIDQSQTQDSVQHIKKRLTGKLVF